jgi:hypothetical protein
LLLLFADSFSQMNYAPFTKNRREIVTIQKNYGVGGPFDLKRTLMRLIKSESKNWVLVHWFGRR